MPFDVGIPQWLILGVLLAFAVGVMLKTKNIVWKFIAALVALVLLRPFFNSVFADQQLIMLLTVGGVIVLALLLILRIMKARKDKQKKEREREEWDRRYGGFPPPRP